MSYKLFNRARMSVSGTPGTGDITLGSATTGFQDFSTAGAADGDTFPYLVEDGTDWEFGVAIYTSVPPSVSRAVEGSSNGNALVSFSSSAIICCSIRGDDIVGMMRPPVSANLVALQNLGSATLTDNVRGVLRPCLHVQPDTSNVASVVYCALQAAPAGSFSVVAKVQTTYYAAPADGWEGAGVTIKDGVSGYIFYAWLSAEGTVHLNHTLGTGGVGSFATGSLDGNQQLSLRDIFLHLDYTASGNHITLSISANGKNKIEIYDLAGVITSPGYCGIAWSGTYANSGGGVLGGEHDFLHYFAGVGNGF